MSTSDSAAGAPDFVALAETNRSIQNMNKGANNILRDQRSYYTTAMERDSYNVESTGES